LICPFGANANQLEPNAFSSVNVLVEGQDGWRTAVLTLVKKTGRYQVRKFSWVWALKRFVRSDRAGSVLASVSSSTSRPFWMSLE
jgi:hypothetical protein